jgi:zinc transporter 1
LAYSSKSGLPHGRNHPDKTLGYSVHSLALVADSFHMLNDVLSLCVGLWAVKVAHQKSNSKMYTYGWQRAETLGALVNGVFLVALCLSIFLDAIQRFVEPQAVSNPKLVLIVGCCGLVSNFVGLFLFHEHGHSHGGGHGHSHNEADKIGAAEEGHGHTVSGGYTAAVADEGGNVADVLPQSTVAGFPKSDGLKRERKETSRAQLSSGSKDFTRSDEEESTVADSTTSPLSARKSHTTGTPGRRRHNSGGSRSRFSSIDDIPIHPASFRKSIITANRMEDIESRAGSESETDEVVNEENGQDPAEDTPLLGHTKSNGSTPHTHDVGHSHNHKPVDRHDSLHASHNHNQPKEASGGGHSHSDLNMRGVFLHVMGDALGNLGVIGSALIIWLTHFSWRFYADPVISLIITIIILGSAIPLCKAASRILLQAVPAGMDVDDIKEDIEELPGILSCHHLHVWQLSDVKMIASLHVQVGFDFKGEGSARYMKLASAIRRCLHEHGIHSSTIQPEFCLDSDHRHPSGTPSDNEGSDAGHGGAKGKTGSKGGSRAVSMRSEPDACLLDCGDECDDGGQCCAPSQVDAEMHNEDGHSH